MYYVNYGQIAALLVEGVKSLNKTVDSLSLKLFELQNSYNNLITQNQILNNVNQINLYIIKLKNRKNNEIRLLINDCIYCLEMISNIFNYANREIYNILNNSNFLRYRQTKEFERFLTKFKEVN